ncbi:MAG: hypothetical protein ABUT39_05130 [Acidobacteriota bacterium]
MILSSPPAEQIVVPFDADRWKINAVESRVEDHLGRRSLYLKNGNAFVADARFADGSLEFDVAFTRSRGFVGGIWRVQDAKNVEEFYLRPHQSGNPDATQYTPVFNGVSGWQLYHGERYTVAIEHRFDEWTHMKILFAGTTAEIYVGDMAKPVLVVDDLKRSIERVEAGSVGVSSGVGAPAWFSNFSFSPEAPRLQARAPAARTPPDTTPEGTIPSWQVSDVFAERDLDGRTALGPEELTGRRWTRLETESSGLANLARLNGINPVRNTVLARKTIVSEREQIVRLDFGFSDRVRVYLNGRLLFRGADAYQSRDYRFLGSIGYFDSLWLPLAKGGNELLMAVSEDLGGWGIQAKLEDLAGITLKD